MSALPRAGKTKIDGRTTRFARKIVVHAKDVEQKHLEELTVGDLTHEGPVLAVSLFDHTYTTPAGEFSVIRRDDQIGVFARLGDDALEVLMEAMRERRVI